MLSQFGKFCRKLRIEKNERLLDMAQKLEVPPSFLSAVEFGKKSIPEGWKALIIDKYNLSTEQIAELQQAIDNSVRILKFDLSEKDDSDKDLLLAFARKFQDLDTNDKESILSVLKKQDDDKGE